MFRYIYKKYQLWFEKFKFLFNVGIDPKSDKVGGERKKKIHVSIHHMVTPWELIEA
jgi:hypothetical protein